MRGLSHLIRVKDFLDSRVTTRSDGEVLRKHILQFWNDVDTFEIDFQSLQIASVSFLDEAFGMLAEHFAKRDISKKIKILNMNENDEQIYRSILGSRIQQFKKMKPVRLVTNR